MIHVQCPRCQTRFTTSDANLGKTGQCPKCGNPIKVQASPPAPSGGGQAQGDSATAGPSPEAGPASESAMADSALGAARRHAAQASASGPDQAEAPARPAQRPSRPQPETQAAAPPAEPQPAGPPADETAPLPRAKSKTVALVLCIFLGGIGIHRFYMGSWGWGLVILGLSLTCIGGAVFAIVDVIRLATMDKADFQDRYSETVVEAFTF